jgi:RHS repeat-associated protein
MVRAILRSARGHRRPYSQIDGRLCGLAASLCALVSWLACAPALTPGAAYAAPTGPEAGAPTLAAGGSLVAPDVELLAGAEAAGEAREAQLDSPEAVAERERSRTQYEGIGGGEAVALAERVFDIGRPSWSPPGGEAGQITKYLGAGMAQERTPGGTSLLLQSSIPLRSAVGSGQLEPVSLALGEAQGEYRPANPLVPVAISKSAAGGVSLPLEVSVAPARTGGSEASSLVGDRVVYPGTAPDTDFMVEPAPAGVETSWQLLSQASSEDNALEFRLPAGASLRLSASVPRGAEVVREGQPLALIPPAYAVEADGSTLPVSYAVSGTTLTTHVDLSGSVAFPVMVDPLIVGYDGESFGANVWYGWQHADNCGCFSFPEYGSLIQAGTNPGPPTNDYGQWLVYAPGAGAEGGASIERVDVSGLTHQAFHQSYVEAGIWESSGSDPVYSFNGGVGASGASPLVSDEAYSSIPMAFCAQGAGGHDGGEQPLCNENYGGKYFELMDILGPEARTVYNYVQITGAGVTYLDTTPPNEVTLSGVGSKWVQYGPSSAQITAKDQGVGVQAVTLEIPPGYAPEGHPFFAQEWSCAGSVGFHGCPSSETSGAINLSGLATGAYTLGASGYDAVGNVREQQPAPKLYIDHAPPKLTLSGPLKEASGGAIGEGAYELSIGTEDGTSSAPQSGMHLIDVYVDGRLVYEEHSGCAEPTGVPAPGCMVLPRQWTFEGQRFGVGVHTVKVVASDWVGNSTSESFQVIVNGASYQALGPGAVNLKTGDYKLVASDASIAAAGGTLTLSRSFDSREPALGAGGPLGPQWALSVPDIAGGGMWQSLRVLPNGSVQAASGSGSSVTFTASGEGFASPSGYQTVTLSEPSKSPAEYQIKDSAGDVTTFTRVGTAEEEAPLFMPSTVEQAAGAGGLNQMKDLYRKTSEGVVEPVAIVAPEPAGVSWSCSARLEKHEELANGCRALEFVYAEATNASGESESEWGEYKGRLKEVLFWGYSPTAKAMTKAAVAAYAYDKLGRLRTEWDPQVSPALKTRYGYDAAGRVTALTSPGQQTWAFVYGTAAGDANAGRLMRVVRPAASVALWNGMPATMKTGAEPSISSASPVVGKELTVSHGEWTGGPVGYGYQWEDCNPSGAECAPIVGADDEHYTPIYRDEGKRIEAVVTATNGGGSATYTATTSNAVPPIYVRQWGSEGTGTSQFKAPSYAAVGKGLVYVSDTGNNRVQVFNESGKYEKTLGSLGTELGKFKEPEGVAADAHSNVYVADSGNKRLELIHIGEFRKATTVASRPVGLAAGPIYQQGASNVEKVFAAGALANGVAFLCASTEYGSESMTALASCAGSFGSEGTGHSQFKGPSGDAYAVKGLPELREGYLYVVDTGNDRVQVFHEKDAEGTSTYELQFGSKGKGAGQLEEPTGIGLTEPAVESRNAWVADSADNRIEGFGPKGEYLTQFGSLGSGEGQFNHPTGVAVGAEGRLYLVDTGNDRVQEYQENPKASGPSVAAPAPPAAGSSSIWTVEYQVPLSGSGAPNEMGSKELERWAQKDDPVDATAIFPPTKPMGWPAQEYKQASVYYLDSSNRTVDVQGAAGGIATSEYDSHNDLTRTLSPDDRATALGEGAKSAEAAEHLSTVYSYNEGGEAGTELRSTLGPEHEVKLPGGAEAQARKLVSYTYDQGAPGEGGPYRLPTTTAEAALVAGKEEDKRSTKDSYSGQEGLGWKLHEPTSTTSGPGALSLTHTTLYSSSTGSQLETKTPAGVAEHPSAYGYPSSFGTLGSENGQLKEPAGIATTSAGNFDVLDRGNSRVEEFSSSGSYLAKFGSSGTGSGQFKAPAGIAVDAKGDIWVADTGNNRVQEFNSKREFLRTAGFKGTGAGQLEEPRGVAVAPNGNVFVLDANNNRVEEFNENGLFVAAFGWGVSNGEGKLQTCSSVCRAGLAGTGAGELKEARGIAVAPNGNVWVADTANSRVQEYTESGEFLLQVGTHGSAPLHFNGAKGIAVDSKGNVWVADSANGRIQELTAAGDLVAIFASKGTGAGQLEEPFGIDVLGKAPYVADMLNNRIQSWTPVGNEGARDSQVVYYSAGTESSVIACQSHPEWANLPCQTQPAHQPEVTGLPELPITTFTYNFWDEPEVTRTVSGSETRVETDTYDAAGRLQSRELTSTTGTSVPKVSYAYNTSTGMLVKESTGSGEEEMKLESAYNSLGQLESYTDASGVTSTYKYDADGRPTEAGDGKGTQRYTYNGTTGLLSELTDTSNEAMKFTVGYDAEGNAVSDGYPNGMTMAVTFNAVGELTGLAYEKTTHCTENCVWYSDTVVPSIHGQWMSQTSTLSKETYGYDEAGRLVQTEEVPVGKHCKTRLYTYDEDGNRIAFTKYQSASEACTTEGLSEERHAYDTADRLLDTGTEYNPFDDIKTLPALDAGGQALTSRFYSDGQLAEQEQAGETIGYKLDPARRTLETNSTGEAASSVTNHYSGEGATPAWTSELGGKWTRYIPGPAGMVAIQTDGETPVLQIANLHGDIIGTASMSETATKLLSTTDTSEYGVPTSGAPPRYSWLGTKEIPTELPSGVTGMGARSYVPTIGRFLQPDPKPGGSANSYAYTYGNPLNESDPSGQWTLGESSGGLASVGTGEGTQLSGGTGIAAGAIMPAPVNLQVEAEFEADPPWDQEMAGAEEYEEWEESEEWWEEVAFRSEGKDHHEVHIAPAVLYQPLGGEVSLPSSLSQKGSEAVNRAMKLCQTLDNETRATCSQLINYVIKMSRRLMRRLGGIALVGGDIAENAPIPNAVAAFIAKVGGAYLEALGQEMLSAVRMSGKGSCYLSFHTFKVPLIGDTGIPDGAHTAQCH